jgi:hypothetical protein
MRSCFAARRTSPGIQGVDNRLDYTSPVADVLITRDAEYIVANNI